MDESVFGALLRERILHIYRGCAPLLQKHALRSLRLCVFALDFSGALLRERTLRG